MKKILLTLVTGFCFGSLAMAQEPGKVKATKAAKPVTAAGSAQSSAKVKAKEEKAKAFDAGKTVTPVPVPATKAAALTDPRSN